ncbi:MAG TPA: hypothetical protein H9887_03775 [Candidatus Dorea intestinavium]|nr:hypothetical protein [Candidatus Dorea intestinavium]
MKRRVMALISAVVLMFAMGITATAADSVTGNGVVAGTGVASATDKNGNNVKLIVSSVPSQYADAVAEVKTASKLKELLGDAYVDTMEVVGVYDVSVEGEAEFPITATFTISGVTKNTKVATLHYDTTKGAWEKVASTAGDGTITATFNSLSPVAFVVDKATTSAATTGSTTGTSPKTNGTTMTLALALISLVAAGSVVYLAKRKNVQA